MAGPWGRSSGCLRLLAEPLDFCLGRPDHAVCGRVPVVGPCGLQVVLKHIEGAGKTGVSQGVDQAETGLDKVPEVVVPLVVWCGFQHGAMAHDCGEVGVQIRWIFADFREDFLVFGRGNGGDHSFLHGKWAGEPGGSFGWRCSGNAGVVGRFRGDIKRWLRGFGFGISLWPMEKRENGG